MREKFFKSRYLKKEKGFALMAMLMILATVSILGIGLLTVTASNHKQTSVERDFQSVYYIAEAGLNQAIHEISKEVNYHSEEVLSHDDFFQEIDAFINQYLDDGVRIIDDFEEVFGEKPLAMVTVQADDYGMEVKDENINTKTYLIESVGKIGSLSRTVNTSIEVAHGVVDETVARHTAFDYALYNGGNSELKLPSGSNIDGSIYGHKINFSASGTKVTGSIISEKSVQLSSEMEVRGNIYAMDGTVKISSDKTKVFGDIHATNNVILSSGTTLNGNIYTNGDITLKSSNAEVTGDIHVGGNVSLGSSANVQNIFTKGSTTLGSSSTINGDIHSIGDISLGSTANVQNIFTNGNITLSSNNTVNGEIHSTGNVTFNGSAEVGHIFTKGYIRFNRNITVNGDINSFGNVGDSSNGGGVTVNGDIYSGSNVTTRNNQTFKFMGNVHAAGNVENGQGNTINGNVISAKSIINRGTIGGDKINNGNPTSPTSPTSPIQELTVPQFEAYKSIENPELNKKLLEYQPSTEKTIVSTNTLRLSPGSYGIIEFDTNQGGTIILESGGGDYFFNSITGGNQSKTMRLDFSKGGNINIYVKNNLKWNGAIEVSTDGTNWINLENLNQDEQKKFAERIYWETHGSFEIHEGGQKHWLGTLLSKGKITTASSPYIVGALLTHGQMDLKSSGGTIIYASGNGGSNSSGSSGGGSDEGETNLPVSDRIKIGPIREKK